MTRTTVGLAELPEVPHFLYWLYDRTDALLYIGITNDPKARFKHHRRHKDWWPDVDQSKTRVDYFASRNAALKAEAEAIKAKEPLYNDQHNLFVDTPARLAAADAITDFAVQMLADMLGDPDEVKDAIREGEADMAELRADGEEIEDVGPAAWAAGNIAQRMLSTITSYERATKRLLAWLPDDITTAAYEKAAEELGVKFGEDHPDLIEIVLPHVENGMAARLIQSLDPNESQTWRAAARYFLSSHRIDTAQHNIIRQAAGYARAARSANPYLLGEYRCKGVGGDGCPEPATQFVVFNQCTRCGAGGTSCRGHGSWCETHFGEFLHGNARRTMHALPAADPWALNDGEDRAA